MTRIFAASEPRPEAPFAWKPGPSLEDAASDHAIISRFDRGAGVKDLQRLLNQDRLPATRPGPLLAEDGWFGGHTEKRVREFQHDNGLSPDGLVGPKTVRRAVDGYAEAVFHSPELRRFDVSTRLAAREAIRARATDPSEALALGQLVKSEFFHAMGDAGRGRVFDRLKVDTNVSKVRANLVGSMGG